MAERLSESMFKILPRFPKYISGLAIAFGVMALTGWAFHIQRLKGFIPGQVAVKANAAVCFVLIGLALWLAISGASRRYAREASRLLALVASMIGLLSFLEYRQGWDLGIDQLLFTAGPDDLPGSVRLALMSPIAAADFFLLGIAIVVADFKPLWWRALRNLVPAVSAVAAMFGILDFVLDPQSTHTHIAPLTALILFLLSFAVLFARAEDGPGALLVSRTFGGLLCRRLLPSAILIPIGIAWLRWRGQQIGLYSDWTGLAIMTVISGGLLAALTVWTAFVVDRAETDRGKAEQSAHNLAAIVTCSNDAIIGKTLDGIVTSWNPGAEAMYGFSAEEMIGRSVSRVIPPDRLDEFEGFLGQLRRGELIRHRETERIGKDGRRIPVSISISPIKDEKGNGIGASTIARNISERKQAEERVLQASRYARSLIEASLDPLVTISKQGKITDVNEATEKATGLSRDRLIGSDFCDYFSEPEKAREGYGRVFDKGFVRDYPLAIRNTSGAVMEVLYNATVYKGINGEVEGVFAAARDITERKRAEEEAQAGRDRLALAMAAAKAGSFDWNIITNVDLWSREKESLYGLRPGEFSGTHTDWKAFVIPDDRPRVKALIDLAFQTGDFAAEFRVRRRDNGEIRWMNVRAKVVFGENAKPLRMVGFDLDVTEQKQAEEKLKQASWYTRSLIEASLDPLVTISKQGKITDVNQATETATGLSRDRLIGSDFCDYFTEPAKAREGYGRVFEAGVVRDYPLAIRNTSGAAMDVLYNATVFKGPGGEVEGVFAAARDMTERKRAVEALQAESAFRRSIIENAAEGLCVCQMVDVFPYVQFSVWNEQMRQITGYGMEEINSKGWYQTMYPDPQYQERARQRMLCMRDGDDLHGESWEITRRDGEKRLLEITTSVVTANDGTRHVLALMDDVSELERTERELRFSRERLALALKAGHSGTFDWDMQNNVNRWTPEVEEVHGLAPGEFGGTLQDWETLVLPDDLPAARACIESSLQTGEFAGDWRIRRRNDGQIRWIAARAKILNDDKGKPWRMIGLNMDVTERKQAEEEVRKLNDELEQRVIQRTAQLEEANRELEAFTYSVSHDLRAPLRHISGFSKMLSEEFSASLPPDAQHHVERIREGTRRMGQLVDDLLNLGRVERKELSLQVAGLRSITDDVIASLKSDVDDREVEWKIGDLPYVECDTALMQQVLQNLLSNALKFTRPRAKAVIEIGQEERDGGHVVYVRDNGVGFSMKYADKLFGVFQRLHRAEDFEGTGVGLATVQRIIQKHGGRIWAEAELDKGASFYFTLGSSQSSEEISKSMAAGVNS